MKTKPYTVVLLRPDYMTSEYGQDVYVALVKALTRHDAHMAAQKELFEYDCKDGGEPRSVSDYALCVMFEGHHNPALYGWQL